MRRIAYSGVEGAFAHIVAKRLFPDELYVAFRDFGEAYESVKSGECDFAVLPIENSYAGKVKEVAELLDKGELYVKETHSFPIVQNLLGMRGSRKEDIKRVISHPKALEQCDEYIKGHGYETIESTNTAVAAKEVIDRQDMSFAAIASLETAARYGLKVLDEKINIRDDNKTTFAVVTRKKNTEEKGE
jgi:prephenate dehydratase